MGFFAVTYTRWQQNQAVKAKHKHLVARRNTVQMIFRNAIAHTREIFPPRQEIAATNASSHFGDLRGRSTCQAGNGPIDQTTAGLKVWRRATVKRPTGPLEKPPRKRAHRYRSYHARTSPRILFSRMWQHMVPF